MLNHELILFQYGNMDLLKNVLDVLDSQNKEDLEINIVNDLGSSATYVELTESDSPISYINKFNPIIETTPNNNIIKVTFTEESLKIYHKEMMLHYHTLRSELDNAIENNKLIFDYDDHPFESEATFLRVHNGWNNINYLPECYKDLFHSHTLNNNPFSIYMIKSWIVEVN